MQRHQLTADASLLFVTAVWGATFVMVQDAVTGFPVFAFLALRFALAALTLLPFFLLSRYSLQPRPFDARNDAAGDTARSNDLSRSVRRRATEVATTNWLPGMLVGLALFAGYAFQTFGLRETTPAKAGFITGMSVVLVPLGQAVFLRRPPRRNSVIGVGLAAVGLALLSLQADLSVSRGDLLVFGCAVAFAAHILLVGRYAPDWPPLRLAFVQIVTVAVLSGAAALLLERPIGWPAGNVWFAAAFTGLLATALAFFVQSRAQQATSPTHTALIFAAEPVFAGLFSFLLIGETLGPRQVLGSALIVAGMLVSEFRRRTMKDESGVRTPDSSFIVHHSNMDTTTIADLQGAVARFVDERDWQVYHTPKSLSMSVAIEAAELMEHFQWHGNGDSRQVALQDDVREAVAGELADVLIYCLALANAAGLDAGQAVLAKLAANEQRFPPGNLPSRHRLPAPASVAD